MHILDCLDDLEQRHRQLRACGASLYRDLEAGQVPAAPLQGFRQLVDALTHHVQREEDTVFPHIRRVVDGARAERTAVREAFVHLEREHQELLERKDALRARLEEFGAQRDAVASFLDAFEVHNRIEDDELLPAVRAVMSDGAAAAG